MANNQRYREGGWGWFVVLAGFMVEFIVFGTLKAFGVLLTTMKEDLDTDLWIIGSIAALHYGVLLLLTPVVSVIARKYGSRIVIMIGGVLYGLGLVICSTTYNTGVVAVSLIAVSGVGASCIMPTIRAEMAFYFCDKYTLAVFVLLTGSPVGIMLYGPMTQVLLDTYGWRGAMLLLGGIGFSLIWCGLLVRRPTGIYAILPNEDIPTNDGSNDNKLAEHQATHHEGSKCGSSWVQMAGLDIFTNIRFVLVAGLCVFYNISYGGFLVYMVPNALELGLSSKQASFLTTAFGVGSLVGLFLAALIQHTKRLSLHAIVVISGGVSALVLALGPIIPTFGGQLAITFTFGVGIHCVLQASNVLLKNLPFGDDRFILVLGWMCFLSGVSSSFGDVIAGWVYDTTGSFLGMFLLLSAMMIVSVMCGAMEAFYIHFIQRSKESGYPGSQPSE